VLEGRALSQYPWTLLAVYVVTTGSVQLLALWAAYSPRPWLLRALVVWTPIALLATIRAYEPALLLLMSAALTIGICLTIERYWPRVPSDRPRPPLWRFRLADLLVVMLFVATWLALARNAGPISLQMTLPLIVALIVFPLALLSVLVHRVVTGPRRLTMLVLSLGLLWINALLMRRFNLPLIMAEGRPSLGTSWTREEAYRAVELGTLPLLLAVCLSVPVIGWRASAHPRLAAFRPTILTISIAVALANAFPLTWMLVDESWRVSHVSLGRALAEVSLHAAFLLLLAGYIALFGGLTRVAWGNHSRPLRLAARAVLVALAITVFLPGARIYWLMHQYAPFPSIDYGPVNHFARIMSIAMRLGEYQHSMTLPPSLDAELDEVVVLLRAPNFVPHEVMLEGTIRRDSERLTGHDLVAISSRLQAAAVAAKASGQPDLAADYAMAMVRFDAMLARGASWGYGGGANLLCDYRRDVSPGKARELIDLLQRTLDERDDLKTIIARDRALSERQSGWHAKLRNAASRFWPCQAPPPAHYVGMFQEARHYIEATNRLLQTDLAVRAFHKETGAFPRRLGELIPEYLPVLPIDPYSGEQLRYCHNSEILATDPPSDLFVLYSVGPDGIDDGGKFVTQPLKPGENYDLRLEPLPGL
jgi:hypothetical protein